MKNKKKLAFAIGTVLFVVLMVVLSMVTQRTIDPENYQPAVYSTIFALLPPVIAIVLALITKEVYSSLFIGIVTGAFLYANGNPELSLNTMLFNEEGGMITKLADSWNVGILVFLVILGVLVALMNKVGGSAAFGQWASKHIKSRVGTQLATIGLGVLIFIDDYFNCLTVGSVMRPVTDRQKISRAKLSYLIDATAAPVCIIAPVSSWAAAVTSSVPEGSGINGFAMFLNTIPYNLYAILTIIMMIVLAVMKFDFGPMKKHEINAMNGDLFTTDARPYGEVSQEKTSPNGRVIDLVFPVIVLIICCIIGMVYTGGFFEGVSFIDAFADADASVGLVLGSTVTLVITFCFYMIRGTITFKEFAACIPEGFKAMVAPILILTLAWTLSGMTGLLGAKFYVHDLVEASAGAVQMFLPAIIFVVALFLAFSTGTSWGTFAILIPIVCHVFGSADTYQMLVISISACLAGAVCGDHCSPISDTTIMASAGAHCDHVNHVSTQLPYALTAAAVSFAGYILAGVLGYTLGTGIAMIATPVSIAILIVTLVVIKKQTANK
ncbi:MAG: Na+/H+ antiporter NhaC family protein [Clostridia bacterium]|nr:Na+/H+ antiporter NhaC family protein [Clostridia bacterium]MBQ3463070.1 Na+/H+ antiporter NhaC family protein [Clostridia bacterium]MBQ3470946.1 Na+/H+ antiporter NhaC family protein [Clostridia bacterium]MBQ9599554.1 Na+/H+ antiporter NhaC family protein [Clostridia bacterium]